MNVAVQAEARIVTAKTAEFLRLNDVSRHFGTLKWPPASFVR
jgi:hypothetical protein